MATKKFPKITRKQARAVKAAADQLVPPKKKIELLTDSSQSIIQRAASKKPKAPTHEEKEAYFWAVALGVINGEVPARSGLEWLDVVPLGNLRNVEARERDNGKRSRKRLKLA